mgnify:CR=1 FL=1
MGYYSKVSITIKVEDYKIKDLLHLNDFPALFHEALSETGDTDATASYEEGVFAFQVDGIKWYETYHDIREVMDYLKTLNIENYHFVYVGEDSSDQIELGEYADEVYIVSDICYP